MPIDAKQTHKELGRFIRFSAVGASGTLIDFTLLTILKHFFGWPTLTANMLSYSVGIVSNFTFNRLWTFTGTGKLGMAQFLQFATVSFTGLLLNTTIVHLLEAPFGMVVHHSYSYLPAKIVATALVALWNFFANRYWTFGSLRNDMPENNPYAKDIDASDNRKARRSFALTFFLRWQTISLVAVLLLAAYLRLVNIESVGDANVYYTAAVKSMLESPANFFFVAAEPGGSASVDKPPVALWLQAFSASLLGVNGVAVTLPQVFAGILSVLLIFTLVKRHAGMVAGLVAAFTLAVSPVSIAVDRTNEMDSVLVLSLLVASWAFIKATESGKLRHLLLAGALVGVAFNVKMMQAYLALPAFYGLYLLGASVAWRRKLANLILLTGVVLVVSFSWATIVDRTPASHRPYVGSSDTNSEFELAIGYNGLRRLLGSSTPIGNRGPVETRPGGFLEPGGGGAGWDVGRAGILRMFTPPLGNEMSWLLPLALVLLTVLGLSVRLRLPLDKKHWALMLWGGWLVTGVAFFSVAGFFHAYYLATIAPPLAALVGIGIVHLWHLGQSHPKAVALLALVGIGGTLVFQLYLVSSYEIDFHWEEAIIATAFSLAIVAFAGYLKLKSKIWRTTAFAGLAIAVLITPAVWGFLTAFDQQQFANLPGAYAGNNSLSTRLGVPLNEGLPIRPGGNGLISSREMVTQAYAPLVQYLETNETGIRYLVAVPNAMTGAPLVLETGKPVLYLGGFSGSDPIFKAADIERMVENGSLRYVIGGSLERTQPDAGSWIDCNCGPVSDAPLPQTGGRGGFAGGADPESSPGEENQIRGFMPSTLLDCDEQTSCSSR